MLTLSPFGLNAGMGLLTAIVLLVALGADLLFLPPLLMQIDKAPTLLHSPLLACTGARPMMDTRRSSMKRSVAPLVIVAMLAPALALAGPAEDKGLEIAKEADRRDEGFGDSKSEMVMVLRNKRGQESKRELEIRTLEVKGDGDKSLTVFHTPRDVRGTALLTFSHGSQPTTSGSTCPRFAA